MSSKVIVLPNKLICTSFPKGMILLLCIFYFLAFLGVMSNTEQDIQIVDYITFHSVIIIFLSMQKYIKTTFNKCTNEVVIETKGLLNNKITKICLSDVKTVEMSFGHGGSFAKGGTVVITTELNRINITSSDITKSSSRMNEKNQKIINAFVFSDFYN